MRSVMMVLRTFTAACLLVLVAMLARAQELTYLPLQLPGQASVAVDPEANTAYIIDYGSDRKGKDFVIDDEPLLDHLERRQVKSLVVSCSHPHADHMGGIKALFSNTAAFFRDAAQQDPRFDSITFIDDGINEPLQRLYDRFKQSLKPGARLTLTHAPADHNNAFAAVSKRGAAVHVENIPYDHDTPAGKHGRSVVTKITLGGTYTVVDFDDASTGAIKSVVAKLRDAKVKIDAFVVPHHGSAYHDVQPILELGPTKAIITVNPANRYRHPAPSILVALIDKLGAENVLFTGSVGKVVLDGTGVKAATYTAAKRASFELFVAPNRDKALKKATGRKDDLALFAKLDTMMGRGDPDAPPPPHVVSLDPGPKGGGGGAGDLVAPDLQARKTMVSRSFEVGRLRKEGAPLNAIRESAAVPGITAVNPDLSYVAVVADAHPTGVTPATLAKSASYVLPGEEPRGDAPVTVQPQYQEGLRDGLTPSYTIAATDAKELGAGMRKRSLPQGGMVFLDGGKLFAVGPAGRLAGGTLDLCGTQLCIIPAGESATGGYVLPFAPTPLFSEVWDRVFDRGIASFYLSINPTKRLLEAPADRLDSIPSDVLRFGTGTPPAAQAFNEVVMSGDIDDSPIGEILWKADVAFKSASLGRNVLTASAPAPPPVSLTRLAPTNIEEFFESAPEDRWCRLYWTSGSQRIVVDSTNRKVVFAGDAVVARAEAMRLERGRLVDRPSGTWCGASKVVAQRLQRAANGDTPSTELARLRQLARMQAFAKWARENGITVSAGFRASMAKQQQLVTKTTVPTWTSGIRTKNTVYVQPVKQWTSNPWKIGLHVSTSDLLNVVPCVSTHYIDRREKFEKGGLELERGKWMYEDSDKPFFAKWINEAATNVAQCAGGELLTAAADPTESEEPAYSDGGVEKPVFHSQPIHIHGGVLLGSDKEQRRAGWLKQGRIALPDGRVIVRTDRSGGVDFWAFDEKHPTFARAGHHVTISHGKLLDIDAVDGRMRVLVETKPGSTIRQEARVHLARDDFHGAEWIEVRHAEGPVIASKAAWLCNAKNPNEVCVSDTNLAGFGKLLGATTADKPGLLVEQVKEHLWLVDIDVADVRENLDERRSQVEPDDTAARLALLGEYVDWGFGGAAEDLVEAEDDEALSEDFILLREYDPVSLYLLTSSLAEVNLFLARRLVKDDPAAYLKQLRAMAEIATALPATYSYELWNDLAEAAGVMPDVPNPKLSKELARLHATYRDKAVAATALHNGARNPWGPEQEKKDLARR